MDESKQQDEEPGEFQYIRKDHVEIMAQNTPTIGDIIVGLLDTDEINEEAGGIEEEDEESSEEAENLKIDEEVYKCILIDLTPDMVTESFTKNSGFSGVSYLADPRIYTSCFPASYRLLALLKKGRILARGEYRQDGRDNLATVVTALTDDMQQRQQPTIYRVACALHGFVLIVRGGNVEHLEGFATQASTTNNTNELTRTTVLQSARDNRVYTLANARTYLNNLASATYTTRNRAAKSMGWSSASAIGLATSEFPTCNFRFDWECAALKDIDKLGTAISNQIARNRTIIGKRYKAVQAQLAALRKAHIDEEQSRKKRKVASDEKSQAQQ